MVHTRHSVTPDVRFFLFDWGNTLMIDFPDEQGPMFRWRRVEAVDGALTALRALSRTGSCFLATNAKDSLPADIQAALARVHLDTYIKKIFCYRELGHAKPSPEFYLEIVKRLACDPHHICMTGDSLENDVYAAAACGFRAVWYNPSMLPVPDGITSITALPELLDVITVSAR